MFNIKQQITDRVNWIKEVLESANALGVVFGASGGKDSVLVGILCRMATENVTGLIMPCGSAVNYNLDRDHASMINTLYDIETAEVDLTETKAALEKQLQPLCENQEPMAYANINPRLRMTALYNYAARKGYLVAGTSNRSEITMGYFTKFGDGGFDFNPIADLTVREVYILLRYLEVPKEIIEKAPSAGLYDGQTDEKEMGLSYDEIDDYLLEGKAEDRVKTIIETAYAKNAHKRMPGRVF